MSCVAVCSFLSGRVRVLVRVMHARSPDHRVVAQQPKRALWWLDPLVVDYRRQRRLLPATAHVKKGSERQQCSKLPIT